MIKLALEVPAAYLPVWSPLVDFDFVLAHKVLQDEAYAKFFAERPVGRETLLDNSMHELGHALPIEDLRAAAKLIKADYVIAPDELGKPKENEERFHQTLEAIGGDFRIGVVMSGRDAQERAMYLKSVEDAAMLLLPYREHRLMWFYEQQPLIMDTWDRIHLLGVNELDELAQFRILSEQTPEINWSVDTAKPIKLGVARRQLDDGQSLRKSPLSSFDLLNLRGLEPDQEELIVKNIHLLRNVVSRSDA